MKTTTIFPVRSFSGPSFTRTIALTLLAIAGMFTADAFIASADRAETRSEAEDLYQEGRGLLAANKGAEAADRFQSAITLARDNEEYRLALGEAQVNAGRLSEAESTFSEVLTRNADGGAVNLALARVLAREGRMTEAFSYYHRAIYGQWKNDAARNRLSARFELAKLLAAGNAHEDLLAELLPLQAEAPDDDATRLELARLFIEAGSPNRAAPVYRDVLRAQPRNADAWVGLGDSEFALANYRTALADYQSASRYRPDDTIARTRAGTCAQVLLLDPVQRGLGTAEQYRRSLKILGLVGDSVAACNVPPGLSATLAKALTERVPTSRLNAAYEANLDLAEKLWQTRTGACAATAPPEYLTLTLRKLAQ